ncbi:MAG: DcrB-related protein [Polyangiaceae bacterium]
MREYLTQELRLEVPDDALDLSIQSLELPHAAGTVRIVVYRDAGLKAPLDNPVTEHLAKQRRRSLGFELVERGPVDVAGVRAIATTVRLVADEVPLEQRAIYTERGLVVGVTGPVACASELASIFSAILRTFQWRS